jgi:nucleoside phosphorylase
MDTKLINQFFENKQIKKILYVIVMEEESNAVLEMENFKKDEEFSALHSNLLDVHYLEVNKNESGSEEDKGIIYIIRPRKDPIHNTSLFGTEISFLLTYLGIHQYKPDVVISMGYAGYTNFNNDLNGRDLGLGDVAIAREKSMYHSRVMIIKEYEKTCEGHYPLHNCENMVKELNYFSCRVGTDSSFIVHDHCAFSKEIHVVEMELCSVARAAAYFNIPCVGVKIISDTKCDSLDEKERQEMFIKSLMIMREKFFTVFKEMNAYMLNKNVGDL